MLLSEQILCHTIDSSCYFFGMVNEELAVVHALEDLDVGLRAEEEEVFHLRFGDKSFFGAVPKRVGSS